MFSNYGAAIRHCVSIKKHFHPKEVDTYQRKHELFRELYAKMSAVYDLDEKSKLMIERII